MNDRTAESHPIPGHLQAFGCAVALIIATFALNEVVRICYADMAAFASSARSHGLILRGALLLIRSAIWVGLAVAFNGGLGQLLGRVNLGLAPTAKEWLASGVGIPIGILAVIGSTAGLIPEDRTSHAFYATGPESAWFYGIYAVAVAPFSEEIVMRGTLYSGFRSRFGIALSIIFVLLVHTYFHWGLLSRSLYTWKCLALLEIVLCLLREWSKSIWACVLCHAAYNAMQTVPWFVCLIGMAAVLLLCVKRTAPTPTTETDEECQDDPRTQKHSVKKPGPAAQQKVTARDSSTHCSYCGREAVPGAPICPECGTTVPGSASVEAVGDKADCDSPECSHKAIPSSQKPPVALAVACGAVLFAIIGSGPLIRTLEITHFQQEAAIAIRGSMSFQRNVTDALHLLQEKAPAKFASVTANVCVVVQDDRQEASQADIWICPPCVVLKTETTTNLQWCAGGLVHEATHIAKVRESKLRHGGLFVYNEVLGTNVEIAANTAQAEALQELDAPAYMAAYVRNDQGQYWSHSMGDRSATFLAQTNPVSQTPMSSQFPYLWAELEKLPWLRKKLNDCGPESQRKGP